MVGTETIVNDEKAMENTVSLTDQAHRVLRRAILSCRLTPGQRISEAELQGVAGQPRTPTREAAMRLIADGLLEVKPRAGYRVSSISVESAEKLYAVHEILSVEAVRESMHESYDSSAVKRLRAMVENPPQSEGIQRIDDLLDISEIIFSAMVRHTRNPWLNDSLFRLESHVERIWAFSFTGPIEELINHGYKPILKLMESAPTEREAAMVIYGEDMIWLRRFTLAATEVRLDQLKQGPTSLARQT
jgi:DNA-binding GntR family transcriptional regulator